MEISSELFSWLCSLNITPIGIEPLLNDKGNIILSPNIITELQCGKHMLEILTSLQEGYNKFYGLNLNYTEGLQQLNLSGNINHLSSNIKYTNWQVIGDVLLNFGIIFEADKFLSLSQGNLSILKDILNQIFTLCNELMHKSIQQITSTPATTVNSIPQHQPLNSHHQLDQETINIIQPIQVKNTIKSKQQQQYNNNNQSENKSFNLPPIEESNFDDPSYLDLSKAKAFNDISKISANSNHSTLKNEAVNINDLNTTKEYSQAKSTLEFFIISLMHSFNISSRQAVALLANNRKYLTLLFYKGIKGSFDNVNTWIDTISSQMKLLIEYMRTYDNSIGMGYAIIGVGLYSKSNTVTLNTLKLLENIRYEIGTDHDWLISEGFDLFIYSINKHENLRNELLKQLYDFIKDIIYEFITHLKAKYAILDNRNSIISFMISLMPYMKNIPTVFEVELFKWIIEACQQIDPQNIKLSLEILTELWTNKETYSTIDIETKNTMLNYFKISMRNMSNLISLTAISLLFELMKRLAEHKTESGPMIYKTIVFLFLENYDNEIKRELFLQHFSNFYFNNQNVPLTIFIEPYTNQLLSTQNYSLCDFTILSKILCHPRMPSTSLKPIIEFALSVSLGNIYYSKCASLLLVVIFNNKMIFQNKAVFEIIVKIFITHIKSVLSLYLDNIHNDIIDNAILEAPYDILIEKIPAINEAVKDHLINTIKICRRNKGKCMNSLLALLWFYLEHDDIMMQMEEECTVKPDMYKRARPISNSNNASKDNCLSIETNQRNKAVISTKKVNMEPMKQSVEDVILRLKKDKEIKVKIKREALLNKKIKEQKLRRSLEKQLAKKSITLGIGSSSNQSKLTIDKQLIQDEGSIINNTTLKIQQKPVSRMKLNTLIEFNTFNFLINLTEEEPREQKAIEAYTQQYKKKLKTLFKSYNINENQIISKAALLKLLRDKSFINTDISLDELSFGIRNCFGQNINDLSFDQFTLSLLTLSYIIFNKRNKSYTISECYYHLLNAIIPSTFDNALLIQKDKHKQVINYIKACISNDVPFNYPPGYKQNEATIVVYKPTIPKPFQKFLIEPYRISLMIVNEIIEETVGCHILESFIKVKKIIDIDIDPGIIHKWTDSLTIAYCKLDPLYDKIGIEVADCLEEMLKALCKGKDKMGNAILHPLAIKEIEKNKLVTEIESKKDELRQKRMKEIKEKAQQYKKDKEELKKLKEQEKDKAENEKKKEFHDQLVITKQKNIKIQEEIKEIKKKKDEDKQIKAQLAKQKKDEDEQKLQEEKQRFFKNHNRKLKEQFIAIKSQKETIAKRKLEKLPINQKLPEVQSNYLTKDKSYIEFEKNLTNLIESLRNRADIREVFSKYEEHLRIVFDIYLKLGRNKLSLNIPDEAIQINEYKEFLVNFTVFGLLITPEQINFVFKKLSRRTEEDQRMSINFNDFIISIMYLAILSKLPEKTIKILPTDIENINSDTVNNFFSYLGFSLPFDKKELENMINIRRGMSAKEFFELQQKVKREKVDMIKERKLFTVKSKSRLRSASSNNRIAIVDVKSQKTTSNCNSRGRSIEHEDHNNNEQEIDDSSPFNSDVNSRLNDNLLSNGADGKDINNDTIENENVIENEENINNNEDSPNNKKSSLKEQIISKPKLQKKQKTDKTINTGSKKNDKIKSASMAGKNMKICNAQGQEENWIIKN